MTTETDTAEELLRRLEDGGHRLTAPRRSALAALAQRPEGFTVEELCREVPWAGRATIYRTVRLLVRMGLVCKLSMLDGKPLYNLAQAGHHHHAICLTCGSVADVSRCGVDHLLENIQLLTGSQVMGHRLEVYVLCASCRATAPQR
ncbi:MAG: transcriptional repressor [Chloroflexi bacterium]|nr:transcriptional repressor [Chloroflexota bacterium]